MIRFDPNEYGAENSCKKQREFFRKIMLQNRFDFLFFMGVDTIPPIDTLERLLAQYEFSEIGNYETHEKTLLTSKKIMGGVYFGRQSAENGAPDNPVAWIHGMEDQERKNKFLTMNNLVEVDGMGMDCVLIPRSALESISFMSWLQNDDDYPFYDKAKELGYSIIVDTNVQCKHYFEKNGYAYLGKVFNK